MPSDESARKTAVRVASDSFYALCQAYRASPKFAGLSAATQNLWARELEFACRPNCLGSIRISEIKPSDVQKYLDGWSDKPGKQAAAITALRALEKWAVVRDFLPKAITLGVETGHPTGSHIPWTDAHVLTAEQHARSDISRAITLGANTGQRISDLVRMCPTDIETFKGVGGINVVQLKTGRQIWIPLTDALAAAMETWPRSPGPFLRKLDGRIWIPHYLTCVWDLEKKRNPELSGHQDLVLHGLRGHACVRLSRQGLTDHQIGDLIGMSSYMVSRYTRLSAQKENALAAVVSLSRHKSLITKS